MARIRTIKPEFWTDEKVVELSAFARLLFIGIWNFCDDEGRMAYSPKRLKMQIFPADSIDCAALAGELIPVGLVSIYAIDGVEYLQVHGFAKHQKIDKRSPSKLPPPPTSTEPRRIPPNPADGMEGNGMDQGREGSSVPAGTGDESPPTGEPEKLKTPDEMTKEELWLAGKSLLEQSGIPKAQCGTIVGKLVKDYGNEIVIDAVRAAVLERPADAVSFLKASCMARKGEGGKSLIPWHATDDGVLAKGLELTPPVSPYPGETNFTFRARVVAAAESAGKPPVPRPQQPAIVTAGEPTRMSIEAVEQGRAAIRAAAGVRDKSA